MPELKYQLCAALLLAASCWSMPAVAQSTNPASRELIGTGPKVEIQTSANATLDVGGAGAANTNVTGENLRGNLGASIPQRDRLVNPVLPAASLPVNVFGVPDLSLTLHGLSAGVQRASPGQKDIRFATELILPRFRDDLGHSAVSDSSSNATPDASRYRYANGRWWYWKPNKTWAYWDGSRWRDYSARG
jgi:hypothetical protein